MNVKSDKEDSFAEAVRSLVKLLAYAQIKDQKDTGRKAQFLKVFGLSDQEIAELLGLTRQAVNTALLKLEKGRKGPKKPDDTPTDPKAGS